MWGLLPPRKFRLWCDPAQVPWGQKSGPPPQCWSVETSSDVPDNWCRSVSTSDPRRIPERLHLVKTCSHCFSRTVWAACAAHDNRRGVRTVDGVAWHPLWQQLHSRRVYPPDKNERPRVFSEVCACARARFSWGFIHVSHYLLALVVSGLHCSTVCVRACACTCVCTFVVCTCWKFKMSGRAEIKQVANSWCAQQI